MFLSFVTWIYVTLSMCTCSYTSHVCVRVCVCTRVQTTLCGELVRRLMVYAPTMHQAASVVAEVDCLVSFALAARELNDCRW